jgi:ribonuclease PH
MMPLVSASTTILSTLHVDKYHKLFVKADSYGKCRIQYTLLSSSVSRTHSFGKWDKNAA